MLDCRRWDGECWVFLDDVESWERWECKLCGVLMISNGVTIMVTLYTAIQTVVHTS